VSHWALALRAGNWTWEAHEHYQKGGYRNRCHIAGANGALTLSVPLVKGKHRAQPIREVAIDYRQDWPRLHWQSIQSAYGRAPFFDFYADAIAEPLQARPATLWALNSALFRAIHAALDFPITWSVTEEYQATPTGYIDIRAKSAARRPPGFTPQPYPQLFREKHGFMTDLSILDLLFCTGPEAVSVLYLGAG
jgi:hypothetical protein